MMQVKNLLMPDYLDYYRKQKKVKNFYKNTK